MRISDWSSDVCSSDLVEHAVANVTLTPTLRQRQNIDAVEARAVELSAGIRRGIVRFEGSAAYTDAIARGSGVAAALDGMRPAQTPRWAASATLSLEPEIGRASCRERVCQYV